MKLCLTWHSQQLNNEIYTMDSKGKAQSWSQCGVSDCTLVLFPLICDLCLAGFLLPLLFTAMYPTTDSMPLVLMSCRFCCWAIDFTKCCWALCYFSCADRKAPKGGNDCRWIGHPILSTIELILGILWLLLCHQRFHSNECHKWQEDI